MTHPYYPAQVALVLSIGLLAEHNILGGQNIILGDPPATITAAKVLDSGVREHSVDSPYQNGPTKIRVLMPSPVNLGQKFPVIYVLPVEAGMENKYGDGLAEILKLNLHNIHAVIFVAPTFFHLPWYCDHPTDPRIRQESHLLKVVVPFVEKTYPAGTTSKDRLLLGFSKSGWGAWSLLLRNADTFGRAAAWDAPMMMDQLGKYGTSPIFGTPQNLQEYCVSQLLRGFAQSNPESVRFILTGYGGFRRDHVKVHALMTELNIPHIFRDGPDRKHDWHSGWVDESVKLLINPDSK